MGTFWLSNPRAWALSGSVPPPPPLSRHGHFLAQYPLPPPGMGTFWLSNAPPPPLREGQKRWKHYHIAKLATFENNKLTIGKQKSTIENFYILLLAEFCHMLRTILRLCAIIIQLPVNYLRFNQTMTCWFRINCQYLIYAVLNFCKVQTSGN